MGPCSPLEGASAPSTEAMAPRSVEISSAGPPNATNRADHSAAFELSLPETAIRGLESSKDVTLVRHLLPTPQPTPNAAVIGAEPSRAEVSIPASPTLSSAITSSPAQTPTAPDTTGIAGSKAPQMTPGAAKPPIRVKRSVKREIGRLKSHNTDPDCKRSYGLRIERLTEDLYSVQSPVKWEVFEEMFDGSGTARKALQARYKTYCSTFHSKKLQCSNYSVADFQVKQRTTTGANGRPRRKIRQVKRLSPIFKRKGLVPIGTGKNPWVPSGDAPPAPRPASHTWPKKKATKRRRPVAEPRSPSSQRKARDDRAEPAPTARKVKTSSPTPPLQGDRLVSSSGRPRRRSGIRWCPVREMWRALTSHGGISMHIGYFSTKKAAWLATALYREKLGWPELNPLQVGLTISEVQEIQKAERGTKRPAQRKSNMRHVARAKTSARAKPARRRAPAARRSADGLLHLMPRDVWGGDRVDAEVRPGIWVVGKVMDTKGRKKGRDRFLALVRYTVPSKKDSPTHAGEHNEIDTKPIPSTTIPSSISEDWFPLVRLAGLGAQTAPGADAKRPRGGSRTEASNGARQKRPSPVHPARTTEYIGIWPQRKRWRACISHNGQRMHLGSYETPELAARAWDDKARELRGLHTKTNFPLQGARQPRMGGNPFKSRRRAPPKPARPPRSVLGSVPRPAPAPAPAPALDPASTDPLEIDPEGSELASEQQTSQRRSSRRSRNKHRDYRSMERGNFNEVFALQLKVFRIRAREAQNSRRRRRRPDGDENDEVPRQRRRIGASGEASEGRRPSNGGRRIANGSDFADTGRFPRGEVLAVYAGAESADGETFWLFECTQRSNGSSANGFYYRKTGPGVYDRDPRAPQQRIGCDSVLTDDNGQFITLGAASVEPGQHAFQVAPGDLRRIKGRAADVIQQEQQEKSELAADRVDEEDALEGRLSGTGVSPQPPTIIPSNFNTISDDQLMGNTGEPLLGAADAGETVGAAQDAKMDDEVVCDADPDVGSGVPPPSADATGTIGGEVLGIESLPMKYRAIFTEEDDAAALGTPPNNDGEDEEMQAPVSPMFSPLAAPGDVNMVRKTDLEALPAALPGSMAYKPMTEQSLGMDPFVGVASPEDSMQLFLK